ncbi:family S53 protease [Mycena sp. CBHHK59/15]|nr:family S53 protease [Mycena sp. CBHHK59/15]
MLVRAPGVQPTSEPLRIMRIKRRRTAGILIPYMAKSLTILPLLLAAVRANFLVLETRDSPPNGFSRTGPTPLGQTLNLRFALAQRDIAGLQDTVYEISTPGSPRYGQYLTKEEVEQFAAPSEETVSQINSWFSANNLSSSPISPAGDWIAVNMTVSQANALLLADFSTFQNEETNQTVVRTLSYSIPSTLKTSINAVYPTVTFPMASVGKPSFVNKTTGAPTSRAIPADCQSDWSPACLQSLYGIPSTPAEATSSVLGVSGFSNAFANKRDLAVFLETYRPDMPSNTTFSLISVDGGINNQLPIGASSDSAADIQYTIGLATGVPIAFISTGTIANDVLTEFLDQAHHLLSMSDPPRTVVNTIGGLESQVPATIAIALCNAYAQLAARGVSYIVQTGIWGAGGNRFDPDCKPFDTPFPATCPFVTAIGGTEFYPDETVETASPFSGGGFSGFFKRPRYQDGAVSSYLKSTGNTHSSLFNVSGRAVPDLSAISQAPFVWDGEVIGAFQTPAFSADIFAAIVALLSAGRIAAGKPGLGFLNPLLYQNPNAFADMASGNNPGCMTDGFNATAGWDPVTGFGSPLYRKLAEICAKL